MNFKKSILAAGVALSMAMTPVASVMMTMPVMAETTTTYTVTINDQTKDNFYLAYQVFTGDLYIDSANNNAEVLSNIDWGSGVDYTNPKQITINSTTSNLTLPQAIKAAVFSNLKLEDDSGNALSSRDIARNIANALGSSTTTAEDVQAFADIVSQYLADSYTTSLYNDTKQAHEMSLPAGYYFIKNKPETISNRTFRYRYPMY